VVVGSVFHVKDGFTRIERIQIRTTSAATSSAIVFSWYDGAGGSRAVGCLLRGNNADASAFHIGFFSNGAANGTLYMANCVAYDMGTGHAVSNGFRLTQSTDTWYAYNCTAHNCASGLLQSAGTCVARNCLTAACTDGFTGTFDAASDYNASDLASDAPGANSRNAQTFTFVDEGADDLHLAGTDGGAQNFGTDLSGDSAFPFSTDFDGETRAGSWDIGADEVSPVQLVVADLAVAAALEAVALTQANQLAVADLAVTAALEAVALTQANQLAVEDLAVTATLEPVTLSVGALLEVAELAVATILDGVVLTQAHQLAPADLLVAASLEASALVQAHVLTVGDLAVAVVLDGVILVLPAGFDRALLTNFTLAAPQLAAVAVAGPQLADVTLRSPRLTSITVE
jgi:hypothetical protein